MGKFDTYFLMEEKDVLEYVKEHYSFFDKDAILTCREIGDGNLNYVFRISEDTTGKSMILKHSGTETRAKSGRLVDTDRNRIEAEILMKHAGYAKEFVPEIYGYDPVMCCMAMEDLKDYQIMRTALLEYRQFPGFADHITTYMAEILLPTTDVAMDHKEKKKLVKQYINPDLCQITEQLVYSESLGNFSQKNIVSPEMQEFVEREIYADQALRLEGAKLKFEFMNHAQALIHGDLHSGSIFINSKNTKVFDPEFAFYGPMGYDLGNVTAHLLFAGFHARAMCKDETVRRDFLNYISAAIKDTIDLFRKKFFIRFDGLVTDEMAKTPGFKEYYLEDVLRNAAATTGIELIRRVVGVAKVRDITSIEGTERRRQAQQDILLLAKTMIFDRKKYQTGQDYQDLLGKYGIGD